MHDQHGQRGFAFTDAFLVHIKKLWWNSIDVLAAFFNVQKNDTALKVSERAAHLTFRRILYFFADYLLAGVFFALVIALKAMGYAPLTIIGICWVYALIAAGLFWVIYERTGHDLSLGTDIRRAVDVVSLKSRLIGMLSVLTFWVMSTIWYGPERIVLFYRKEMSTGKSLLLLLGLTLAQTIVWVNLYSAGYESLTPWLLSAI